MKHSFTSLLASIPGPSSETICALQLLARVYKPAAADRSENRWFDEHSLSREAFQLSQANA